MVNSSNCSGITKMARNRLDIATFKAPSTTYIQTRTARQAARILVPTSPKSAYPQLLTMTKISALKERSFAVVISNHACSGETIGRFNALDKRRLGHKLIKAACCFISLVSTSCFRSEAQEGSNHSMNPRPFAFGTHQAYAILQPKEDQVRVMLLIRVNAQADGGKYYGPIKYEDVSLSVFDDAGRPIGFVVEEPRITTFDLVEVRRSCQFTGRFLAKTNDPRQIRSLQVSWKNCQASVSLWEGAKESPVSQ